MSETRDRYVLLCQQALVLAVVAAVVAPAAGVVTLDIVSPSRPSVQQNAAGPPSAAGALVASEPVSAEVTEVPLTGPARSGRGTAGLAARALPVADGVRSLPQPVGGFATVGVTWQRGVQVDEDAITISVRTKQAGTWTDWESMEYHDDHGPDAGTEEARKARPGTDPFVTGEVEDVQVKVVTADGSVPADLKLAVVDPKQTPTPRLERPAIDTAQLTAFESGNRAAPGDLDDPTDPGEPVVPEEPEEPDNPAFIPTAGGAVTPQPQIFSRAQWGADERMRDKSSLRYGEVHAGFVHHTVNANGYKRSDVPAILRGIYAYHTQSRGWSDIGYNFLVDRFGRIWEGRYGGVGRPAVGAHTLGYNEYAFAMSAIGNYETTRPSTATIDAYARLLAWKLSLHGVSASSTSQRVGSRYFPAINGHRDAAQTACPGRYLYAKLSTIRTLTASYQHSFAARNLRTTISGTTWPDLLVRDRATKRMSVVRTGGQAGYRSSKRLATGFGAKDLIATPGDITGDGMADVVARDKGSKVSTIYPGTGGGPLGQPSRSTKRWVNDDTLIGVGDFDGDGKNDLVGRKATTGKLWLYPGKGGGRFSRAVRLASTWEYTLTTGVGDFDRDGDPDLVARDSAGRLYLIPGRGGKLGEARLIGVGFNSIDLISGRGDITNDGAPDLIARVARTKQTRIYIGNGSGGVGAYYGPFPRFKNVDWISGGGQFAGTGANDVVGRNGKGQLVAFANTGGKNVSKIVRTEVDLSGTDLLLNVGDWNNDGFGDVMTRTTSGRMLLRLGKGNDRFADPVVAGIGWSRIGQIVSVGDVTGDGNNDLMARVNRSGVFKIYPGNGATAITSGYLAHSSVASDRQVAVGLYDGDGAPDTMVTRTDGSLWLYPGNGPGGMTGGRQVLSGLQAYDWLVGLGDLDGDRRSDLLARSKANGWLYLIPGTSSGFASPRLVAPGFRAYDLAG